MIYVDVMHIKMVIGKEIKTYSSAWGLELGKPYSGDTWYLNTDLPTQPETLQRALLESFRAPPGNIGNLTYDTATQQEIIRQVKFSRLSPLENLSQQA